MPFQLSPAEEQVRKMAQEYTERTVICRRKELEIDDRAVWSEQIEKQGETGFHLHIIPRNEGGTGIGFVASCIAKEEICAGWPDLVFSVYYEFAYYFAKATGGEVAKKFMPGIIKGEVRASPVITEPSGGSDVLGLQSTARKVGGGWILNGRKCFIDEGEICSFVMTLFKTGDPNAPATKGLRSLTAFIVEKGMPGYRVGRIEDTLARKEDLAELIFDNVFVPDSHVVGGESGVGRGMAPVFAAVRDIGRLSICSDLNGMTLGSYRCSVQYAKERHLYGRPIADLQAIQFRIADMAVDLEATRALTYRAAWLRTQSVRCDGELAIAKYFATQAALRCSLHAVNIHGAYGVLEDYMPQRYYRAVPPRISAGGTDEAMKNLISMSALQRDGNPDLSGKSMEDATLGGWKL